MNSKTKNRAAATLLVTLVLLAAFLLAAACAEMFGPELDGPKTGGSGAAGPGAKNVVTIYLSGSAAAPRTLYPDAPHQFSKYKLSFPSGPAPLADIDNIPAANTTVEVSGLVAGTWEIKVEAYADIDTDLDGAGNGVVKVAEKTVTHTVDATEASKQVLIKVEPTTGGGDGYFAWDLDLTGVTSTGPADIDFAGTAALYTYRADGNYTTPVTATTPSASVSITLDAADDFTFDPANTQYNHASYNSERIYKLPAGYYFMKVVLENAYQKLGWAEIVQVKAGLITKASKTFADADFVALKKLMGSFTNANASTFASVDDFELLILDGSAISSIHSITKGAGSAAGVLEWSAGKAYSVLPKTFAGTKDLMVRGVDSAVTKYFTVSTADFTFTSGDGPEALGSRSIAELTKFIPGAAATINNDLTGSAISQTFQIQTNGQFAGSLLGAKSGWLQNGPAGVTLSVVSYANGQTLNMSLTGTPTGTARGPVQITLPAGTITGVPIALPVDNAGPLSWNVLWSLAKAAVTPTTDGTFTLNRTLPVGEGGGTNNDVASAKDGDTVTIVDVPDTTRIYAGAKYWLNTSGPGSATTLTSAQKDFIMPAGHTTVEVLFAVKPGVIIQFDGTGAGDGAHDLDADTFSVSKTSGNMTVTMTGAGYEVEQWLLNGDLITDRVETIANVSPGTAVNSFTVTPANLKTLFGVSGNEYITQVAPANHTLTAVIKDAGTNRYSRDIQFTVLP